MVPFLLLALANEALALASLGGAQGGHSLQFKYRTEENQKSHKIASNEEKLVFTSFHFFL